MEVNLVKRAKTASFSDTVWNGWLSKAVLSLFDKKCNGTTRMWSKASPCNPAVRYLSVCMNLFSFKENALLWRSIERKSLDHTHAVIMDNNFVIKLRNSNTENCGLLWVDFFPLLLKMPHSLCSAQFTNANPAVIQLSCRRVHGFQL